MTWKPRSSSFGASVFILLTGLLFVVAGCRIFFPTRVPIRVVPHQKGKKGDVHTLVIFLPGRGSEAEDFGRQAFDRILTKAAIKADSVAVDAHVGYYMRRSLLKRLRKDVIELARRIGYKRIWLVGISMGGIGALLFAQKHGELIDGVLVLAPFLGDKEVIDEVAGGGGLRGWSPKKKPAPDDYQRRLWLWLKGYAKVTIKRPLLAIGYGKKDRFARENAMLGAVLPKGQVFTTTGGHDWDPWKRLFSRFVNSRLLKRVADGKK